MELFLAPCHTFIFSNTNKAPLPTLRSTSLCTAMYIKSQSASASLTINSEPSAQQGNNTNAGTPATNEKSAHSKPLKGNRRPHWLRLPKSGGTSKPKEGSKPGIQATLLPAAQSSTLSMKAINLNTMYARNVNMADTLKKEWVSAEARDALCANIRTLLLLRDRVNMTSFFKRFGQDYRKISDEFQRLNSEFQAQYKWLFDHVDFNSSTTVKAMNKLRLQCENAVWNAPAALDMEAAVAASKAEEKAAMNKAVEVPATPATPVVHPGFDLLRTRLAFERINTEHLSHLEAVYPGIATQSDGAGAASLAGQDAPLSMQAREYAAKWMGELGPENARLRTWLADNDIAVIPNAGRGNNCLIISLLQHATGNYADVHHAKAQEIRNLLEHDGMLHCDNAEEFAVVLALINAEYGTNMRPYFVQASKLWTPYVLPEADIGEDPVMIWHQGNHYEALVAKGTGDTGTDAT